MEETTGHTFPVNEGSNPLLRDLGGPKYKAMPAGGTYTPPAAKPTEPEEVVEEKVETVNEPAPEDKPGGTGKEKTKEPAPGPEPSKKSFGNYERTSKWGLRGVDQVASRFLKWLAKDETRDRWKMTKEEHAELLEWATETAEYYDFTVENPAYGFFGTLFLIYADKGLDAWETRQLNEKIAKLEEENEFLRRKAARHDNPDEPPLTEREQKLMDELEKMRIHKERSAKANTAARDTRTEGPVRPRPTMTVVRDTAFEDEEVEFVEIVDKKVSKRAPVNAEEVIASEQVFNFQNQVDDQFFSNSTTKNNNSTAEPAKTTPVELNLNGSGQKFNYGGRKKPTVQTGFKVAPGENIAQGPDGKFETYEPLKQDRRGRQTEIVRCPQSRELFERFVGHDKIFKNNAAKSQYFYWLDLEAQGRTPKGGWPEWWNTG